ncbi:heme o synthase [Roseimaritima sediminicola]|uniref:heme o synthase n=1 Tax=Roseimaritima sediminicola TaxID=2662066 RepID=UPI001386889C|nr:heme o synthase [Roseimaritima sediminicola]
MAAPPSPARVTRAVNKTTPPPAQATSAQAGPGDDARADASPGADSAAEPAEPAEPAERAGLVDRPVTERELTRALQLRRDYLALTKPRIVVMVLVTAAVAAVAAAGRELTGLVLLYTLLGTGLVGASAGVMNQIWERRIDRNMRRTRNRPLPAGRVTTAAAGLYCAILGIAGTWLLAATVGVVPALFGVATWLTYVVIYTPMKTRTSWNTTVGAVSGALPMMIGYTAAGGSAAALEGWLLVAVLVAWQYPHFMAIAWMYRREYGEAGFMMTPVVEPSGRSAAAQSVVGAVALVGVLLALVASLSSGATALVLAALMLAVSYGLVRDACRFARQRTDAAARRMMRASLIQLPLAMVVLVLAALMG